MFSICDTSLTKLQRHSCGDTGKNQGLENVYQKERFTITPGCGRGTRQSSHPHSKGPLAALKKHAAYCQPRAMEVLKEAQREAPARSLIPRKFSSINVAGRLNVLVAEL